MTLSDRHGVVSRIMLWFCVICSFCGVTVWLTGVHGSVSTSEEQGGHHQDHLCAGVCRRRLPAAVAHNQSLGGGRRRRRARRPPRTARRRRISSRLARPSTPASQTCDKPKCQWSSRISTPHACRQWYEIESAIHLIQLNQELINLIQSDTDLIEFTWFNLIQLNQKLI